MYSNIEDREKFKIYNGKYLKFNAIRGFIKIVLMRFQ